MTTTSVTISIPVTARFDGCWCSDECEHMSWASTGAEICSMHNDYCKYLGAVRRETYTVKPSISAEQLHSFVRTRWCCETFGMGEQVKKPPITCTTDTAHCLINPTILDADAVRIGILQKASEWGTEATSTITTTTYSNDQDNETLRRWTSE